MAKSDFRRAQRLVLEARRQLMRVWKTQRERERERERGEEGFCDGEHASELYSMDGVTWRGEIGG
jgi:hypothetical protein